MKKFTLSLFLYCALLSAEEDIFRNNTNETDLTNSFEHGKENNNLIPAKSDSLESFKEQENKEKAKQLMDLKALQSVYFSKNRKLQDNNFNVLYVAGNTNKIRLRYAMTTTFIFDNDPIIYVSLGDPSGFELTYPTNDHYDLSNMLVIKPLLIGVDTNLTVVGASGTIYTFYLFSTTYTSKFQSYFSVFVSNKAESFLVRTYNHSLGILNENIAEKLKIPKKEKEILQPLNANEEQALNTALENNEIDARTFKPWDLGSKEASKENASMSEELTQNNSKLSHFNENSTAQNSVGQNNVKEPNTKSNNSKQNHSLSNSDLTSNTDYNKLVADMFENQMDANGNYVGKKFSTQAYDNKTPYKVATGNANEYSSYLYSKKTKSKDVGMER